MFPSCSGPGKTYATSSSIEFGSQICCVSSGRASSVKAITRIEIGEPSSNPAQVC